LCCVAEGAVYYSEQQFVNAGEEDEMATVAGMRPQQTIAKFGEFIRNFQEDRTTNLYQYAYVWMGKGCCCIID
jgi:hypothetical protein